MKSLIKNSILISTIILSFQVHANSSVDDVPFEQAIITLSPLTFPTWVSTCLTGDCGYKEFNMPLLEKEALEIVATGDDSEISSELEFIIKKTIEAEPKYKDLSNIEILREEALKGIKEKK